jgi:predicted dehydrogenase
MDTIMSNEVRLGVVGLGNIGLQHIKHVQNGAVERCRVTAVSSRQPHAIAEEVGAIHFCDFHALIDSGLCDAVLVATPTFSHREIGEYALSKGLHVLMEKPIGLSSDEGQQMLAKADQNQVFALMLNQRTDPVFVKMKSLIDSGQLGNIQRTHWTMTHWFRPEVYFQVSDWRATWRGEGGGLLVNQCIHNLDIFQWLCGMPEQLTGMCGFGKYHDIEVEDEATAFLRYANGATGVFIGSTGEAPGVNQLDVVGDAGTLSYNGSRLVFKQNTPTTSQYCRETKDMFGMPALVETDITPEDKVNQHALIIENFCDAILDGAALIAPGQEGLDSLSLANAILLSAWTAESIDFPFDTQRYSQALERRVESSTLRTKSDVDAVVDMDKSYR